MKKLTVSTVIVCVMFGVAGCSGISKETYNALKETNSANEAELKNKDTELASLQEKYETLESDYDSLDLKYKKYKKKMKPYEDMEAAEAEARKKAAEQEKAAAEQAEAEKKAAEEAAAAQAAAEAAAAAEAEAAKGYETGITYEQLARTPDDFLGKKIKFYGKVIQVMESDSETMIRLAVNDNYDTVLYCGYDPSIVSTRVLENDHITILGTSLGLYSYQSTLGGKITIPAVYIDKIEQ